MKVCIIIPNYNHGETMDALLKQLASYDLPCIVIDDGSDAKTKQQLNQAEKQFPWVSLVTLPINLGKGGAVLAGLQDAIAKNYTHAIQIDADGQHDPNDISKLLKASKSNPDAIIAGQPIYDETIPKSRLYGRAITNFWVHVETLSCQIQDAMCGFRIYPLHKITRLINDVSFGKAMDFDIEILVRSFWAGIEFVGVPTKVTYPLYGISHFRAWKDNVAISWLHTRLFFGMLIRAPKLIFNRHKKNNQHHWSQIKEVGSLWGLKFTLLCYKLLGRKLTSFLLYPIIAYFYLANREKRKVSKQYLSNLKNHVAKTGRQIAFSQHASFEHFLSFGHMALDKLSVWNNNITLDQIDFPNKDLYLDQIAQKKGGVVFTAHLGNIEIARSLSRYESGIKINAIVFNEHAKNINALLEKVNPDFKMNMIEVNTIDIQLAIELKERVDAGEFIVIVCDRTSTGQPERCIKANFLGKEAYFPQGPFILAGLLQCPTYFMLCLKQETNNFKIIFQEFARSVNIARESRVKQLEYYAQQYAQLLEKYCEQYPFQWFNFFDFWKPAG